ncbi:hypothetical protein E2R51_04100 [Jeotgalibacillus sp. S-D1]|uniref:hypothetical protein n=1 Tax=Jeotgalibacillus sp. S-D1 TaxID=2552189 RepID=UPI00105A29DA|nr:hypothetical protein [Jeotgalibacillus sp. S-D1]TDL34914.1 hypothetical protein E2R51_04100 [Jeotgalibacillus sp. S-D1]
MYDIIKFLNFGGTIILLAGVNLLLMLAFNVPFIDISVAAGIAAIVLVRSFTSPGNFAKANRTGTVNSMETVQLTEQRILIYPNIILNACFTYTLLSLLIVITVYFDYFY